MRYGIDAVKHLQMFALLDSKTRKKEGDLVFLKIYCLDGLKPKCLDFKVANKAFKTM